MCKGTPLCDNQEDLRQCKNITVWETATPLHGNVLCKGSGQQIKSRSYNSGIVDCLNRRDEPIFSKIKSSKVKRDWLFQVNTTCPNKGGPLPLRLRNGKNWRRCLGDQHHICIFSGCKFHIIISRTDTFKAKYNRFALRNYVAP